VALSDLEDATVPPPPRPAGGGRAPSSALGAAAPATPARAPFAALMSSVAAHIAHVDGVVILHALVVHCPRFASFAARAPPAPMTSLVLPMCLELYRFQLLDRRRAQLLLAALLRLTEAVPFASAAHAVQGVEAEW
jgi:hypothetical protein